MSKESSNVEFLIKRILDDGVTKQELNILLKKMDEESKVLGKYRKVSESTKLQRIIGERGISVTIQPTISSENINEFQQYLKYRESAREGCSYMWESLKPKIKDLIDKIKKVEIEDKLSQAIIDGDQEIINYYQKEEYKKEVDDFLNEKTTMTDFIYPNLLKILKKLDEDYFPSLVNQDENWKNPKNYEELYNCDIGFFDSIPKQLKEIFQDVFKAFLEFGRAKYENYPRGDSLRKPHQSFETENIRLRYPEGKRNHGRYYFSIQGIKQDWYKNNEKSNEFLRFFTGTIDFVDIIRNYEAHKAVGDSKTLFEFADRYIKDPLTQMSSPTNYIVLANSSSIILYELMEIFQVWIDSKVIEKRALDGKFTA